MRIQFLIILLSILLKSVFAFTDDYIFKQITVADGLSQSTVFTILQDKLGYMWFGTIDGLNKYDGYKFKIYSNNPADTTSLSDNFISALYEDAEGYIWVGTINGYLNKFDRRSGTFKRYFINDYFETIDEPEIEYYEYPLAFSRNQVNSITSIEEDRNGFLWIGTWGNGILRFDKKNDTALHFYNNSEISYSLSFNRVMDILEDSENNIWIATFGGGINKVKFENNNPSIRSEKEKITFISFKNIEGNNLSLSDDKTITLFEDRDQNLWIGTFYGGLNKLKNVNKSLLPSKVIFTRYITQEKVTNCLCNNTVMEVVQDHQGYLWIGTFGGGIDRLDIQSENFRHYFHDASDPNSLPDNDILSLYIDNSGILWIGSHLGEGVTKLQENNVKFDHLSSESNSSIRLNDDVVWSIYRDESNLLWVGTYRGGLNVLNLKSYKSNFYLADEDNPHSISNDHIRSIREDNFGTIWIGTYNGGINRFNKSNGKFENFQTDPGNPNSLSSNQIQDIFIESDKVIWAATFGGGINKLTFESGSAIGTPSITRFIHDPSDSGSIADDRVYTMMRDSKGKFWIGTYGGGLNLLNPEEKYFKRFANDPENPNTLSNNKVISLLEDSKGNLWIGTSGGGLNKFDAAPGTFIRYSINEGLTSAVVYSILEDNSNNLWMSTDNGIFRFNLETETFTHFGLEDGLQSLEFSGGAYFKDKNGVMYFGGINGINFFHPDSIQMNTYIPSVVISSIKIFNDEVIGEPEEIILSYDQNFISFEFASLDYTSPHQNKYIYILEGLQKQWQPVDASLRMANFTNLPAGEYLFRVKGTNSDGLWNETGAQTKLIINPPFWQTWWFVILVAILIGILIYYVSTNRIKNQLAIEKLKTKIASDLHDNVGAGLTEISILSEVATQNLPGPQKKIPRELSSISQISRELVDTMSDIVWVVNPQRDSLYDLIIKLKDSYNEFLISVGISFQVKNIDKTNDIRLSMDYKQNLLLMFKEAINNAIKHSNCSKIVLEANIKDSLIEMILEDDGTGFKESNVKSGNGIKNMKSRADRIKGSVKWKSNLNMGTRVHFTGKISRLSKMKTILEI